MWVSVIVPKQSQTSAFEAQGSYWLYPVGQEEDISCSAAIKGLAVLDPSKPGFSSEALRMEEALVSWWSPQTLGNRKAGLELNGLSIPTAFLS